MNTNSNSPPVLFLDFDGTISKRDAIDCILESFADSSWLTIEDDWRAGRIGSRECLRQQMRLVRATESELIELLNTLELDEGLTLLLETCRAHDIKAHIISDGFDYCIHRILASKGNFALTRLLRDVSICASHLETNASNEWQTDFPYFHQSCAHGCATCKPAVMRLLNPHNAPSVFVGDGLSDRYAAQVADLVFAKKGLANYCREKQLKFTSYDDLFEVAEHLNQLMHSNTSIESQTLRQATA